MYGVLEVEDVKSCAVTTAVPKATLASEDVTVEQQQLRRHTNTIARILAAVSSRGFVNILAWGRGQVAFF